MPVNKPETFKWVSMLQLLLFCHEFNIVLFRLAAVIHRLVIFGVYTKAAVTETSTHPAVAQF